MDKDAALLPLSVVSAYSKAYPGIWDVCHFMHDAPMNWDKNRCYLPIGAALAIQLNDNLPRETIYMLPALSAWRQWKEVYTFDSTLEQILYDQQTFDKLPSAAIMQIPFPCIFISAQKYKFFAHLEDDRKNDRWELRFARLMEDGTTRAYFIHIGDYSLEESLQAAMKESIRVMREEIPKTPALQNLDITAPAGAAYSDSFNVSAVREMLQLYLYCCASNTDVQQEPQNKKTYRPRTTGKITDKYREIRKWEAGFYFGRTIRRISPPASSASASGSGSPKRPHIRRGHWHHFWKGTGADRRLELHWVFPIMVHGDDSGDIPARITDV